MQSLHGQRGEKASFHVCKSREWESRALQPQVTELKPREERRVTRQGRDPASSQLRGLPSAAGCRLAPSEVGRVVWISGGTPQGYLGEALQQHRSGCNGGTRGRDRLRQVAEDPRDKVGCFLPSSRSPLAGPWSAPGRARLQLPPQTETEAVLMRRQF